MGIGHHGGPAFLATDNLLNLWHIIKAIQNRQIALSRDQKDSSTSLHAQLICQDTPPMAHCALSGNTHLMLSSQISLKQAKPYAPRGSVGKHCALF
jgi:hypothetical protein